MTIEAKQSPNIMNGDSETPKSMSEDSSPIEISLSGDGVLDSKVKGAIRKDVLEVLERLDVCQDNSFQVKTDGSWVEAKCPTRIDLFGGWTDTPPICYEMGGSVVNMAIKIDGVKPITAKARFHSAHNTIKLLISKKDEKPTLVVIEEMIDLLDYADPTADGALLKACIVASKIFDSEANLQEQLREKFNGGLEVVTASELPEGSGLGTSSIMASGVLAAVWGASGYLFNRRDLIQAVLGVEQLLTTGGGWQDQVGGVLGGINRGYTKPGQPIEVKYEHLPVSEEFSDFLADHLVLLFTGKARLAKNVLDVVLTKWYENAPGMLDCFRRLHRGSMQMQGAIKTQNIELMASLFSEYWELKKKLAENSEPPEVAALMKILQPLCIGQSLLGAGGGGFLCAFTATPNLHQEISAELAKNRMFDKVSVHKVSLDMMGIQLYRNGMVVRV